MLTARTVAEQWAETVDFYEEIHPAHLQKQMTRGFWNPPRNKLRPSRTCSHSLGSGYNAKVDGWWTLGFAKIIGSY